MVADIERPPPFLKISGSAPGLGLQPSFNVTNISTLGVKGIWDLPLELYNVF